VLTGTTTLRLRGAYGAAGVQPPQGSAASLFGTDSYQFGNASPTAVYPYEDPGNPNVRPEDDREWEGGAELNAWGNRLSVSLTAYDKEVHNLLYTTDLGLLLQGSYTENVGDVRNTGEEVEITVVPVERNALTAAVTLSGSVNHNKLLRLAPQILSNNIGGGEWFVPGYALYGYFGDTIRYADQNHDGTLEPTEFYAAGNNYTTSYPPLYMGSSVPIAQMAAQPSIAFFRHQLVAVNAVFQYQGGYKVYDIDPADNTSPAVNKLGTPLWLQAFDIMNGDSYCCEQGENAFLSGNYMAWNELSVAWAVPAGWLRAARLRNVHLVLGVQNLALWTTYPFGDPRVSDGTTLGMISVSTGSSYNAATNMTTANNDVRSTSAEVVPLTRQWMLRMNVAF
jgi:hypothetical protein